MLEPILEEYAVEARFLSKVKDEADLEVGCREASKELTLCIGVERLPRLVLDEPLAYERMDMVVDGKVIIENKAREPLDPDGQGQLFAGLAATNLEVGLVLHFGTKARFYRVFFENRFKQRNRQRP